MSHMGKSEETISDEASADELSADELDSFQDELDEYDLLGVETDSQAKLIPDTDLSSTARAFNTRIKKRKEAQEAAHGEAERAAHQRHTAMIKALVSIRKSLREVTRIDLGDRFEFSLKADDWHGWPRLTIRLIDNDLIEEEYPQFNVTAHDRQAKGIIEIEYGGSNPTEHLSLMRENDLMRLPKVLRKCVRTYLDLVGDIVLEAEDKKDNDDTASYLDGKDISEFEEKKRAPETQDALSGDLFEEDYGADDVFDSLPSLDDVDDLGSSLDFDLDD